jgi:hypothetical protein
MSRRFPASRVVLLPVVAPGPERTLFVASSANHRVSFIANKVEAACTHRGLRSGATPWHAPALCLQIEAAAFAESEGWHSNDLTEVAKKVREPGCFASKLIHMSCAFRRTDAWLELCIQREGQQRMQHHLL